MSENTTENTTKCSWVVQNYSKIVDSIEKQFSCLIAQNEVNFKLQLVPNQNTSCLHQASIVGLTMDQTSPVDDAIHYKLTLVNKDADKNITQESFLQNSPNGNTIFHQLIFGHNNLLHSDAIGFLLDDCVTIECEIYHKEPIRNSNKTSLNLSNLKKNVKKFELLLENGKQSDLSFTMDGKNFALHKNILATRLPVDLFENFQAKITEINVETFKVLLKYLYSGNILGINQHRTELLEFSKMYKMDLLYKICELSNQISSTSNDRILRELFVVKNASKVTTLVEKYFPLPSKQVTINMQYIPNQTNLPYIKDTTILRLSLTTNSGWVRYDFYVKLTFLNRDANKNVILEGNQLNNPSPNTGNVIFHHHNVDHSFLLDPNNGFVVDDKLKIFCEFFIDFDCYQSAKLINMSNSSAYDDYEKLLKASAYSDVIFKVGGRQFSLHKNILSVQSPVFAAMFDLDFMENLQNCVELTDVDADVFEDFVRFLYTGNSNLLDQFAYELLQLADKYQIESLKTECEKSMIENLTIETAAFTLMVADMHFLGNLKAECMNFIKENKQNVSQTKGWIELERQQLALMEEIKQIFEKEDEEKGIRRKGKYTIDYSPKF